MTDINRCWRELQSRPSQEKEKDEDINSKVINITA